MLYLSSAPLIKVSSEYFMINKNNAKLKATIPLMISII